MPRHWDVIGFGENSVDLVASIPRLPPQDGKARLDSLTTLPGGQIATAMIGCARLGLRAQYVGSIGSDSNGTVVRSALTHDGVDVSLCRRVLAPTRAALILVESETQARTVLWQRDDALNWPPGDLPLHAVADARMLLVDATDVSASIAMAEAARAAGVPTMADVDEQVPGLDRLLELTDILVVSATFAPDIRHLHQQSGAQVVVATLGPDGAVAWDGTNEHYSPGFVVPVADTTGAGDAFRAGLIAALLVEPWTVDPPSPRLRRASLEFANACAALNCRSVGAQSGLPTRPEVEALVTSASAPRSKKAWGVGHTGLRPSAESLSGEPE